MPFLKFLHHFGQLYPTSIASLVAESSGEWATRVLVQAEIKAVLATAVFKFTAGFTRDKNRDCRTSKQCQKKSKVAKRRKRAIRQGQTLLLQNSWLLNLSTYFLVSTLSWLLSDTRKLNLKTQVFQETCKPAFSFLKKAVKFVKKIISTEEVYKKKSLWFYQSYRQLWIISLQSNWNQNQFFLQLASHQLTILTD